MLTSDWTIILLSVTIYNYGSHDLTSYSHTHVYNTETLGACQHHCQSQEISFFSYKRPECICLSRFRNSQYSKSPGIGGNVVFQTLTSVHILDESKENCVKTTCSNNGGLYYKRGLLISVSCDASYDINNVCVNGKYFENNEPQTNAAAICIKHMSYLPGTSYSACSKIGRAPDRGWKTAPMWSSIFRRKYSKTFYKEDDQLLATPTSCKFRNVNDDSRESGVYRDCNDILVFACEQSDRSNMTKDVLTNSQSKVSEATTGLAVGLALGIFLVTISVAAFVILKRKGKCEPVNVSSPTTEYDTSNIQVNSEPEISHVRGLITFDEYAVINKTLKVHVDTSNRNIDGLYTTPYTEYDRLAHGKSTYSRPVQNTYDTVNGEHVTSMYHTASSKLRISDNLEHYHHIPTNC
ncbi:uncharacterized protein LOC143054083 [Mytilus galloprovincialis]|uniref:uncharacterized protein LOC143054083 n=1 Tax=Mytilus galloprovincialis TaxID=29158 RepID=UPI003F7BFBBE